MCLRRVLCCLDHLLDHWHRHQSGARPQRNKIRPADRDPDLDRVALPDAARHMVRSLCRHSAHGARRRGGSPSRTRHRGEGDHMSEPLVVVGNGMAATRFVDELTQRALGRYSVIVIGAEPRLSYNRVLLSSLLAGDVGESAIELKPRGWWNRHGVTTLDGQAVASIDRRGRVVTLANGQRFTFSKLVLATGSQTIRLPKPGMDLRNVLTFRVIRAGWVVSWRSGVGFT